MFLEAMAGVSPQDRFTDSQLYNVVYQELLVAALPGSPANQAQRVLTAMLVALEHLVVSAQTPRFHRVFAWWLLIQNWATLRFSDHWGILPSSVKDSGLGPHSRFSTSQSSAVAISGQRLWARTAQSLLDLSSSIAVAISRSLDGCRRGGAFSRPPHLFSVFQAGHGCRRRELSYDTASAMQNRVLRMVKLGDEPLFCPSATTILDAGV